MLIRDWRHRGLARRITRIQTLRFAYLADRHAEVDVLALATKNYAGRVVLQEMIDGRTWDRGDVSLLTPVLAGEGMLALQTLGSGIMLALAFACRMQGAEDVALRRTVEEG